MSVISRKYSEISEILTSFSLFFDGLKFKKLNIPETTT